MDNQVAKDILELGTFSNSFMFLILGIMIGSGILGGLVNFFLSENYKPPVWKALLGYCLLGIVAALTVPLFLNMISSNLLSVAHKKPVNLFIFNGICLLFAVFSCRLKENVYNKRFQGTGSINRDDVNADAAETDYDLKIGCRKVSKDRLRRAGISESELKILQVMASEKHAKTSLVGLLKDPELAKEQVNETLSSVMAKGLVEQKLNKENKLRLYLTPKGKQILDKFYN
ncbi:MAG: YEATS-associated helix-containing protein [Thermodesulfobacteriota bacterium]|nr:YEATS-associated helix-containing protein [Thermodesulfobacteriota bacterium]